MIIIGSAPIYRGSFCKSSKDSSCRHFSSAAFCFGTPNSSNAQARKHQPFSQLPLPSFNYMSKAIAGS